MSKVTRLYWTVEEVDLLCRQYGKIPTSKIAEILDRGLSSVYSKAYLLKLTTVGGALNIKGKSIPDAMIKRYLAGEGYTKLAEEYGISAITFANALDRRGIKRRSVSDECRKRLPKMYEINNKLRADPEWRKKLSAKMQGIDLKDWKRFTHRGRISSTLAWRKWRRLVYERDQRRCILCNRNHYDLKRDGDHFDPHHIKMRKHHPELVFDVDNGVTLCHRCHRSINNYEKDYEEFFTEYVRQAKLARGGSE